MGKVSAMYLCGDCCGMVIVVIVVVMVGREGDDGEGGVRGGGIN